MHELFAVWAIAQSDPIAAELTPLSRGFGKLLVGHCATPYCLSTSIRCTCVNWKNVPARVR